LYPYGLDCDEGEEGSRSAYGANDEPLPALKARVDTTSIFCMRENMRADESSEKKKVRAVHRPH
jgi:hypothetical protein